MNRKNLPVRNRQMWLYLVLLLIVVVSMNTLRHCPRSSSAPVFRHSGGDTLDVAIEYSPLSFYSYADTMGGFNYDVLRLLASRHGLKFKFHPVTSLSVALKGLKDKHFDIVAAQFPVTQENRKHYLFTEPLYIDRQVLVQRCDSARNHKIKSQLDIAGCTLHIVAGSPMKQRIEGLSREIGDSIGIVEDAEYGPEQLFLLVATGEIDFAVINENIAKHLAKNHPNVDVSTAISFSQFQALTLRKQSTALCDSLNQWIPEIKETAQYKKLHHRYFK